MAGILAKGKKDKFPSIDAIWDILASLEKFYHVHILKDGEFEDEQY